MARIEIKLTKKNIDALPLPADASTRLEAYDTGKEACGLMIRVSHTGSKSFYVYKRINGMPKRVKLGTYPDMTIEQAQKEARKAVTKISDGIDPTAEKHAAKSKGVTLEQVLLDYIEDAQAQADKKKQLKPRTVSDYNSAIRETFSDWLKRELITITEEDCSKRHAKRSKESKARTNNAFRVLRALFNFAHWKYKDEHKKRIFIENPVRILSQTKKWNDVARRKTRVNAGDIKKWFNAVNGLTNERTSGIAETARDYLLLVMLTGLRRNEAANIKREDVDLDTRMLTITDTKNGEIHTLPLPVFLFDMLKRRLESNDDEYIFQGKKGPITSPDEYVDAVEAACGIRATAHDLRRTFASIAEELSLSGYTIKRLLNHKIKDDVTGGYIVIELDRLRAPMQSICNFILEKAGVKEPSNVVTLKVAS